MLKILKTSQSNFQKKLETVLNKRKFNQRNQSTNVKKILSDVKTKGDEALIKFERKFSKNSNKNKNKIFQR